MVGKLFQVVYSLKSGLQLRAIYNYLTQQTSPEQARKVLEALKKAGDDLSKFPESRPVLPGTEHLPFEVRYAKKWSYKIIFRVIQESSTVRILTIRHDKENPQDVVKDL